MKTKIDFLTIVGGLVLVGVFFLSGCNTVAGFGEDVQKGGHALQKAAEHD